MFDTPQELAAFEAYRASVDITNFPKGWRSWYDSLTPDGRTDWWEGRFRCLRDPLFLSGFIPVKKDGVLTSEFIPILGMDFQENPHRLLFDQFPRMRPGEGCAISDLDRIKKKRMILWPRGLFKTSAVVVMTVQFILNYPNVRICFLTGGDKLAKRHLARVKRVFEKPTKRFKEYFPEFCVKSVLNEKANRWEDVPCKMGTAHEFTVPARTMDIFAEPTFAISTAKSVKSGSHYDFIFIDDLVNDQNYRNIPALEKCYQDYLDICPLLDPTGYIIMTGTRYSYGDTYERIQEKAKEEEKTLGYSIWNFSIRDCWSQPCKNCSHTNVYHNYDINLLQPPCGMPGCQCKGFEATGERGVLFPETRTRDGRTIGHTLKFLEGERIRLGAEFFANQYENRPMADENQTFTEALIGAQTLFQPTQIPDYLLASQTLIIGDLAYVGQEGRDYSVLYVVRVFRGQLFTFDCEFGNWDSSKIAENTVNLLLKYRPNMLYYEKFNGWEAYNTIITAVASAKGIQKVPIEWVKGSQAEKAKLTRIGAIKGVLASRRLWLYAGMRGYTQLVQQLLRWPKLGRHDDFADCLGMVCEAPTGYQLENPPVVASSTNWLQKLHQSAPVDDQYPDTGMGNGLIG